MTNLRLRLSAARQLDGGPKLKAKFIVSSIVKSEVLRPLLVAPPNSLLRRYVEDRPEALGVLIWPYQCSAWGPSERVERIVGHFDVLEQSPRVFQFDADEKLLLLDLSDYREGLRIILDQPRWLLREGHLALNLFNGDHRAYSLSISLFKDTVFIGGLQGRSSPRALELYRDMTKDLHGLRPRDFILDVLRMLVPILGVNKIHAVADRHRYFRHPFFGGRLDTAIALNYDDVWRDRGGEMVCATHFSLPIKTVRRSLEEVSSKKRSMYRKRYEMLDDIERRLNKTYNQAPLVRFNAT